MSTMYYSSAVLIFVVPCLFFSEALLTPYKDCGSKGATIVDVKFGNCNKLPCFFKRGTKVTITMDFKANTDITHATTKVKASSGPIKLPIVLPDTNACHFMKCPIKKGDRDTYKQTFMVKKSYPPTSVVVDWEIMSGDDVITCFQITAVIQ